MPWPISSAKGPRPGVVLLPSGADRAFDSPLEEPLGVADFMVRGASLQVRTAFPPPVPGLAAQPIYGAPPPAAARSASSIEGVLIQRVGVAWPTQGAVGFLPIIPDGRGFGIDTVAGSGRGVGQGTSTLHRVTNLNDAGAGSLREALTAVGPRTVVFETSGTIVLQNKILLDNTNSFLTVAGQTAPSPGITVRDDYIQVRNATDILIQHMRLRLGPNVNDPANGDCFQVDPAPADFADNIVLDHCSLSWSVDEILNLWREVRNTTLRRCIFSEALRNSVHPDGAHSFGPLFGGQDAAETTSVSVIGCLFAHNLGRNPRSRYPKFNMTNNYIYNWGFMPTQFFDFNIDATLEGNFWKQGGDSSGNGPINLANDVQCGSQIYLRDNDSSFVVKAEEWDLIQNDSLCTRAQLEALAAPAGTVPDGLVAAPVSDLSTLIASSAGARPSDRDAVDDRIIADYQNGTGSLIDDPANVGGWPVLAVNTSAFNDPANPDEVQPSGYTKREEHLHQLALGVE